MEVPKSSNTGTTREALSKAQQNGRVSVSRAGRPAETVAHARGQRAHHEVVGVFDQVAHELVGQAAIQRERVPVALVEVIAGPDRAVAGAQLQREVGLTLDADFERRAVQRAEREHLAGDLEHRMLWAERQLLAGYRLLEAPGPQLARVHAGNGFTARRRHRHRALQWGP